MTRTLSAQSLDDIDRAKAIVKSVWLALTSETFDDSDAGDVADTLYEALHRLGSVKNDMWAENDKAAVAAVAQERRRTK